METRSSKTVFQFSLFACLLCFIIISEIIPYEFLQCTCMFHILVQNDQPQCLHVQEISIQNNVSVTMRKQ